MCLDVRGRDRWDWEGTKYHRKNKFPPTEWGWKLKSKRHPTLEKTGSPRRRVVVVVVVVVVVDKARAKGPTAEGLPFPSQPVTHRSFG